LCVEIKIRIRRSFQGRKSSDCELGSVLRSHVENIWKNTSFH